MSIIAQVDGSGTAVATSAKRRRCTRGTYGIGCIRGERNEDLLGDGVDCYGVVTRGGCEDLEDHICRGINNCYLRSAIASGIIARGKKPAVRGRVVPYLIYTLIPGNVAITFPVELRMIAPVPAPVLPSPINI